MLKRAIERLGRRTWLRNDAAAMGAAALIFAVILIALLWTVWTLMPADVPGEPPEPSAERGAPALVRLSEAKLAAADLHTALAQYRPLQETRRVPGTIGYNTARRLEVRLPVGGVVKQILAQPGHAIEKGDRLAVVTSIEVGMARDELVKSESDALLARKQSEWATQIACHLDELLAALADRLDVPDVERTFEHKKLGEYRDHVISAYSKLLLAERTAQSTDSIATDGGVSGIVVRERRSAREVATAAFASISEQSRFEASQERLRAQAELEHTERLVAVKRQNLQVLLGPFAEIASSAGGGEICELILRAPVAGLIEERLVTEGTQIVASQLLFVIANTDTLWVSAHIYEREWAALNGGEITQLVVESPAVPDRRIEAKMLFVSVSAVPETRAIPLVAEFSNADRRFKPGMFAWVWLPLGAPHQALAVPASAITRHEQRALVFVEERPGTYRKVDVTLGVETPEWTEVTHGLTPGQKVVDRGVFVLKSELLLEGEEP